MSPSSPRSRRLTRGLLGLITVAIIAVPVTVAGPSALGAAQTLQVTQLTTNGRIAPLGIPGGALTFGWTSTATDRSTTQSAYEIRVGRTAGTADVWSSQRVTSGAQTGVRYGGPALSPATRYHWQVRTWDHTGTVSSWSASAWFETGLLTAQDWGTAQWIRHARVDNSMAWTDYRTDVRFRDLVGALGVYLRSPNPANGYMTQVNIGGDRPLLRPHKLVNGQWQVLAEIDLGPFGFTNDALRQNLHTLTFETIGTTVRTLLDGRLVDTRSDSSFQHGYAGFRTYGGESASVDSVAVTRNDGLRLLDANFDDGRNPFTGGAVSGGLLRLSGVDIFPDTGEANRPLFRKPFSTAAGKSIRHARLYASAHGIYQLSLNGRPVGDQYLAPGYTEYATRIQSQTYDVTSLLQSGQNAMGAALGDGWWAGKVGMAGVHQYGTQLDLVAKLAVTYTDGTVQWVDTDQTWTSSTGPLRQADLQDGESYDARRAQTGYDTVGFDARAWQPVQVAPSDTARLVPQPDEPVRQTQVLPALSRTSPAAGVYIYDLGQNMVGVPRVTMQGRGGQTVTFRHAEVLNRDGTMYVANLRAAKATDRYTFAADGSVTHQPRFTQHGFRYIEITGVDRAPTINEVSGVVLGSDLRRVGTLVTSDTMVNQLLSNISWGARGNFLSIPTDTPARDERLGWTGDINVFAPTANYMFDMRSFLGKWLGDVRDEQKPNGDLPAVVPSTNDAFYDSGVAWSDAIITVPYSMWQATGDDTVIDENWPAMQRFFTFVRQSAGPDNLEFGRHSWFSNDWLHLDDPTPPEISATAYLAEDARMMAEMARTQGDENSARVWEAQSRDTRAAFTREFVAADGTVRGNSQTGYAMALGMNLISDPALRVRVGQQFVAKLATTNYHLRTGFVGTPWLLPALSSIGRDDLAYRMLLNRTYPSWGYEIAQGATTIWERWDSIRPDGSFGNVEMNSFNHYAYGAVGDWIHRTVGGVEPITPGYKSSRIAPRPGGGISEATAQLQTSFGTLRSAWQNSGTQMRMQVQVPVNTTAEVHVPARDANSVTENGAPATQAPGVLSSRYTNGVLILTVGSGSYSFVGNR